MSKLPSKPLHVCHNVIKITDELTRGDGQKTCDTKWIAGMRLDESGYYACEVYGKSEAECKALAHLLAAAPMLRKTIEDALTFKDCDCFALPKGAACAACVLRSKLSEAITLANPPK